MPAASNLLDAVLAVLYCTVLCCSVLLLHVLCCAVFYAAPACAVLYSVLRVVYRAIRGEGYRGLIIGLTGDTSPEDVAHFKAHGANAVLPKPFLLADFDRIVKKFLGQQGV